MAFAAIADAGIEGSALTGIGITNQRETVVAWDPDERRAGPPRPRLAGPPHRRALRSAQGRGARAAGARADRADHRPLLLRDQDRVAAAKRRGRPRGGLRHDRLLARLQAHRPPPDRLLERLAHDALRHPRAGLGPRALRAARGRARPGCRSRFPPPPSTAPPRSSAARSRSPGSPATSRRRSSARPATPPETPRTPTGPAASCCSTPAPRRPSPARAC